MLRRRTASQLLAASALAPMATQAESSPALTRIAFGSCMHQGRPQPIWDAVLAYQPELFLFMGDNVYGDFVSRSATQLKEAYATAQGIESYARVKRTVPHLAIWDDHDYGKNDGGAEFPYKDVAKEEFLKFFGVPADDPRRSREGIYDSRTVGPIGRRVQVILLDIRWFKSPWKLTDERGAPGKERYLPDEDPAKTMLGDVQWRWLEDELRKPAEVRLVVSSIQVLAEGHGWERWGNFPLERRKLFDTIHKARANGVVFLSGDRHIGALYRETPSGFYPLAEATSSGLNQVFATARGRAQPFGAAGPRDQFRYHRNRLERGRPDAGPAWFRRRSTTHHHDRGGRPRFRHLKTFFVSGIAAIARPYIEAVR